MSTVRAAVESVFDDISTYFALLDFKKNLKIDLSPFGKLYSIGALLRNDKHILKFRSTNSTIKECFQY